MDPTSLPTDNLYKFIALSGLTFSGFFIWLWWRKWERLDQALQQLTIKKVENDAELRILLRLWGENSSNQASLLRKGDIALEHGKKMQEIRQQQPTTLETSKYVLSMFKEGQDELTVERKDVNAAATALLTQLERIAATTGVLNAESEKANKQLRRWLCRWLALLVFVVIVLLGLSTWGFYLWYEKGQQYQDEILILERDKAKAGQATQPTPTK